MMKQQRKRHCYGVRPSLAALCLSGLLYASAAAAQSVAFINPGKSQEIYWVTATQSMQAAAKSLGIAFEVQYAQREPLKTLEIARELVARPAGKRPEYIVITDDYSVADQLLRIIDDAGVKTFLAYSSIPVDQRANTGSPRGKYKGWLGSLEPRAEDAGYMTARALIDRGKREKAFGAVWAGNDLMAFGAMTAWESRGGKPGLDAWFSGINTSTEALEAIKSGRLTSLAGGHFITGAWALVMIHDYHHGHDFADEGLELRRPMFAEFTPQLADRYLERFSGGFDAVDFSRYSKVRNPKLKRYNFGFSQLLEPQS
jgi:ABC-type sugar transport system substrate-binding protein